MKETGRMLVSVTAAAAVFLFVFLVLRWELIFCILLCAGVYAGLYCLLKPKWKTDMDDAAIQEEEQRKTLMAEAKKDLAQIAEARDAITDAAVRADASALYDTGGRIWEYLKENPEKIGLARRFFTYYLDTTAKLLERYVELSQTGLKSEEVKRILNKTAQTLPVLHSAFEKQFVHLMEGELLDVESDIAVLDSMLKMEGESVEEKCFFAP